MVDRTDPIAFDTSESPKVLLPLQFSRSSLLQRLRPSSHPLQSSLFSRSATLVCLGVCMRARSLCVLACVPVCCVAVRARHSSFVCGCTRERGGEREGTRGAGVCAWAFPSAPIPPSRRLFRFPMTHTSVLSLGAGRRDPCHGDILPPELR